MGSYTENHRFYRVDADELVDVEAQLNYNLRRADERVRSLVEWQRTETPFITGNEDLVLGYKWWKVHSNSFWCRREDDHQVYVSALENRTLPFKNPDLSFANSFDDSKADSTQELSFCHDGFSGNVRWRGSLTFGDHENFPKNNNMLAFTIQPNDAEAIPQRTKYFLIHAGVAGSSYTVARVQFQPTTGEVYVCVMGSDQATASQRELSFNDICYNVNDV